MEFSLSVYESWFDALVAQNIVNKVYHIDMHNVNVEQEIKSAYQSGTLLILFSPEIQEVGASIDGSLDEYSGIAFFMKKIQFKGDNSAQVRRETRDLTLKAAFDVREEMRKIARNSDIPCHFFKFIKQDSFSFNKVGPQWDNFYGWAMSFKFQVSLE